MKRTLLLFLIVIFYQINQSNAKQRELNKGTAVVFGVDVLLRSLPLQTGNIIDVVPIASKIEIIDKASLLTKSGDIADYWYKVKYKEQEGFIWGALIADNFFDSDLDSDGSAETFMILNLSKSASDSDFVEINSRIEFRVARNGQMVYEHKQFAESAMNIDSISYEKLKLFTPDLSVMRIKYSFSGIYSGNAEQFMRFNNNHIDSLFTMHYSEGEGGTRCLSELVLPSDKEGKANRVVIKTKCADVSFCDYITGNPPCKWEYANKTLVWDGKKLKP